MITWLGFEVPLIDQYPFDRLDAVVRVCNGFEHVIVAVNQVYCLILCVAAVTEAMLRLCTWERRRLVLKMRPISILKRKKKQKKSWKFFAWWKSGKKTFQPLNHTFEGVKVMERLDDFRIQANYAEATEVIDPCYTWNLIFNQKLVKFTHSKAWRNWNSFEIQYKIEFPPSFSREMFVFKIFFCGKNSE